MATPDETAVPNDVIAGGQEDWQALSSGDLGAFVVFARVVHNKQLELVFTDRSPWRVQLFTQAETRGLARLLRGR